MIAIPIDKPKNCNVCPFTCEKLAFFDGENRPKGCPLIEVVTCGECKWWTKQADSIQGRCELLKMYPSSAWYCGNGERRNDAHI